MLKPPPPPPSAATKAVPLLAGQFDVEHRGIGGVFGFDVLAENLSVDQPSGEKSVTIGNPDIAVDSDRAVENFLLRSLARVLVLLEADEGLPLSRLDYPLTVRIVACIPFIGCTGPRIALATLHTTV